MFVWWGGDKLAPYFLQLCGVMSLLAKDVSLSNLASLITFRSSFQRSWRVFLDWYMTKGKKNDVKRSITCYIRQVKHHDYIKRQTRICTTWPSFLFACRLLFIISTPKLVVSRNFSSVRIALSCFICSFSILRNSHLESDVCRLSYRWSLKTLHYLFRLYSDRFSTTIHAMQSH